MAVTCLFAKMRTTAPLNSSSCNRIHRCKTEYRKGIKLLQQQQQQQKTQKEQHAFHRKGRKFYIKFTTTNPRSI